MASSVAFPGQSHEHHAPAPTPRPPHLPFRRISLPSVPYAAAAAESNRHSVASFDSTPEEGGLPPMKSGVGPRRAPRPSISRRRETAAAVNTSLSEKRRKVVREIFDTERAYVDGLDLIYTNFLMPLIASLDTAQPLLGRAELTAIFSNFIDIWNLHRSFFTSLTALLAPAHPTPPPLSPVLMSHFPYLSLYTPFVTSFPTMLTALASQTAASAPFAAFIRAREADPRCGKLGLRDWLLTIVQRCPRYLLLLKDLLACTDRADPEHAALTSVHTLLSKITLSLNTSLQTHAQTLALLALQRATPNLPFQLISPGRTLMRRGPLLQGQVERTAPDEREFLLFSDCLIWLAHAEDARPRLRRGRSKSETELPMAAKGMAALEGAAEERWSFRGRAELVDLDVVVSPVGGRGKADDEDESARFDVLSPEVSFAVYAASPAERDEWTDAIRSAKSALLVSLNTTHPHSTLASSAATTHLRRALQALPAPSAERRAAVDHFVPAIWVPDAKSDACMRCGARFGWRRRRHHCRLCGRCVCAACSGTTFYIAEGAARKAARACEACYETVFPVLEHAAPPSTLGTLSHLPSWQAMPSFRPPSPAAPSPSALFHPPPSAFHPPRPRPRPQSQPVMAAPTLGSPPASAAASSVNLNLDDPDAVDRRRYSGAALGVHTAAVTARPSAQGEGRAKRFSLVLGRSGRSAGDGGLEGGVAAGRLTEILGRGRR